MDRCPCCHGKIVDSQCMKCKAYVGMMAGDMRYEVWTNHNGEQMCLGWTNESDGGKFKKVVEINPSMSGLRIIDQKTGNLISYPSRKLRGATKNAK